MPRSHSAAVEKPRPESGPASSQPLSRNMQESLWLLLLSSQGQIDTIVGRPGYLGEGVHVAPSPQEELHTVEVGSFSGGVQSSQPFLKHMGEV